MFELEIARFRVAVDALPLLVVAASLAAILAAWLPVEVFPFLAAAALFARRDARVGTRMDAADPERATKEGSSRAASRRWR